VINSICDTFPLYSGHFKISFSEIFFFFFSMSLFPEINLRCLTAKEVLPALPGMQLYSNTLFHMVLFIVELFHDSLIVSGKISNIWLKYTLFLVGGGRGDCHCAKCHFVISYAVVGWYIFLKT
jgi:hypothetical protein